MPIVRNTEILIQETQRSRGQQKANHLAISFGLEQGYKHTSYIMHRCHLASNSSELLYKPLKCNAMISSLLFPPSHHSFHKNKKKNQTKKTNPKKTTKPQRQKKIQTDFRSRGEQLHDTLLTVCTSTEQARKRKYKKKAADSCECKRSHI